MTNFMTTGQSLVIEEELRFYQFLGPLTKEFSLLISRLQNNQNNDAKWLVVGITRSLRGLVFALNTKPSFSVLFKWLWDSDRIQALTECAKRYNDEPLVI